MRERIIMAVFDEIKLKSFKFTMNDLATRLSISKTSLYENFSSKAELIAACVEYLMLDLKNQESEIYNSNKSVLNKFRQLLVIKHKVYPLINTAVYDELKKNYPEQWEKVNNFRQSRINNIIELLNDGVRAGEVVPIKDGVLKIMLNNLFDEAVDEKVLLENNITYADVVNSLVEILINGLAKKWRIVKSSATLRVKRLQ